MEEKKKNLSGEQANNDLEKNDTPKKIEEDTLFFFDQWSTEETDQKEEKKDLLDESTKQSDKKKDEDTELLIFSQWDTSDSQSEKENLQEEVNSKEEVESKSESTHAVEQDEKDLEETREFQIREVTAKTEESNKDDDDLLFGTTTKEESKDKPIMAAPLVTPSEQKPLENPFTPDKTENVVFLDQAIKPTEKNVEFQSAKPNTPPPFAPMSPPSPPTPPVSKSKPIATATPSVVKRSKKWLVGLVAAGLLLIGGGIATYSFAQTDYYRQEIEPKFIGYNITLQSEQKQSFTFDLEQFGYDGESAASIDKKKLAAKLDEIREEVNQPATPAKFLKRKLGTEIEPEKIGELIDTNEVVSWFKDDKTIKTMLNQPRKLPMIEDKPTFFKEDLENVDKELIGTFTTNMGATSGSRVTNIRIASKTIADMVLRPGEQFSWNGYVGNTTADKGYKPAGAIVNKKLVLDYGGGICQVSSTLFNAVEKAGLKIIERSSHSLPVGYVPAGRDATIAYPYKDFKFANNLDKPVVIRADASSHLVTVKVYTVPGAKSLTKLELLELMYPKQKTDSFKKLLLGFDPEEAKREKELQEKIKADDDPYVQITDGDMMDAPAGKQQNEEKPENGDDPNSL